MKQNKKLMDMLADKENILPNNKHTIKASRKWVYCWTHSACSHTSKNCKLKEEGHQDNATYNDMKGESANRCTFTSVKRQLLHSWRGSDAVDNVKISVVNLNLHYPFDNDYAFVDSGASYNYVQQGAQIVQIKEVQNLNPMHLTNRSIMKASH